MSGHKAVDHPKSAAPAAVHPPEPPVAAPPAAAGLTQAEVEALIASALTNAKRDTDAKIGPLRQELADARARVADLETAPPKTDHHHDDKENHDMSDKTNHHDDANTPTRVDHVHRWEGVSECPSPRPAAPPPDKLEITQGKLDDERLSSRKQWKTVAIVAVGFVIVIFGAAAAYNWNKKPTANVDVPDVPMVIKGTEVPPAPPPAPVVLPPTPAPVVLPPTPAPVAALPRPTLMACGDCVAVCQGINAPLVVSLGQATIDATCRGSCLTGHDCQ